MFSKRFKKVVHWLAIVALTLPLNVLVIESVEAANPGDVVITEFIANPALVDDTNGEWLEVQNTTASSITDFSSWKIGSALIVGSATIEPGKLAVVCKNGTVSTNGGVKCDFTSAFSLAQVTSTDYQIILKDGSDNTINTINYNGSDIVSGKSRYANSTNETIKQYGAGDYGTPASNLVSIGNYSYPAIQDAINGAVTGNTIQVADGSFTENLTINKSLSINGAGSESTTKITGTHTITANNVTITNTRFDPSGGVAITLNTSSTALSGLTLQNNYFDLSTGSPIGILLGGYITPNKVSDITIDNNKFYGPTTKAANPWKIGGYFGNPVSTQADNINFTNNIVDKASTPINLQNSNLNDILIDSNTYTNTDGAVYVWGESSATGVLSNFVVSNNTINNTNSYGIGIDLNGATIYGDSNFGVGNKINNNIFDGAITGAYGFETVSILSTLPIYELDATNNYWGSSSPAFASLVSDNVNYTPWWTTSTGPSSKTPAVTLIEKEYSTTSLPIFNWSNGDGVTPEPEITITLNDNDIVIPTKGATSYTQITSLSEGNNTWKVKAKNAMGESISGVDNFIVDQTAPTGTLSINADKEIANNKEVSLTIAGTDNLSGIEEMRISQNLVLATSIDQSVDADWTPFATAKQFTLTTDKDGNYAIYLQLKDKAGNISSIISDTIFYSSSFINDDATDPTVDTVNSNNRIIDKINENGLYLEVSDQTVGDADIVIGEYNSLPVDRKPTGISILGKTFEIKTDNQTVFPISLKYYYTSNDLVDAGVLDETKIVGIYFYDSSTGNWQLYSDTGVVTSNTTIGGIEYEGYVWANLDHLTPLTYGADQTAPEKPANFSVEIVSSSEVKLVWNKVDDAEKYVIRYKKNITGQDYVYVSINKNNTSASIINLEGATEYIFEVASVDKVNNYSNFASAIVATKKSSINELVSSVGLVEVAQAQEEINVSKITTTTTDIDNEGEVKATTDNQKDDEKDESRALITIIILLIALAAGVGGYYGYEYWLLNGQKKTTRKNGKNGKKSGRW